MKSSPCTPYRRSCEYVSSLPPPFPPDSALSSPPIQMAYPPKTPTRHRSRSETKTPLSSSVFGTNHLADASNPFIVASRPASPVKRSTGGSIPVSDTLQRQASAGVIRKGGVESRLDVVTRDYVPPPPKSEKRSRSQPSVSGRTYFCDTMLHFAWLACANVSCGSRRVRSRSRL